MYDYVQYVRGCAMCKSMHNVYECVHGESVHSVYVCVQCVRVLVCECAQGA